VITALTCVGCETILYGNRVQSRCSHIPKDLTGNCGQVSGLRLVFSLSKTWGIGGLGLGLGLAWHSRRRTVQVGIWILEGVRGAAPPAARGGLCACPLHLRDVRVGAAPETCRIHHARHTWQATRCTRWPTAMSLPCMHATALQRRAWPSSRHHHHTTTFNSISM
jgi:hypothetical protein